MKKSTTSFGKYCSAYLLAGRKQEHRMGFLFYEKNYGK